MKLKLILVAAVMFTGAVAYADTLNMAGFNASTGTFSAFTLGTRGSCSGGVCSVGTPFFYNTSSDLVNGSNNASAGDFMNASGSFTGNTNYMAGGGQMYTQNQGAGVPNYASAFSFIRQAAAIQITLLYANSSTNNNAEFGIYDASSQTNALMNHTIVQTSGTDLNMLALGTHSYGAIVNPYATWGVYARTCNANAAANMCPSGNIQTEFSNVAMNSVNGDTPAADSAHMHWALFQSGTNAAVFYLALKDYVYTGSQTYANSVPEGFGDFNDIILRIDTSTVPEPATLSIMGLGLVGLGILGRRKLKK